MALNIAITSTYLVPPYDNTLVLNGINGIYLQDVKDWIVIDARGNVDGLDAQFRTGKPQLAFAMVASTGEFMYETVFVSPITYVVNRLRSYNSRDEFGAALSNFDVTQAVDPIALLRVNCAPDEAWKIQP